MAKVSVILTSYNHAEYLREAIDSVLNQSYQDFELIILDDASTDASWSIIESYTDQRVRAFRNETNQYGVYGLDKAILEETEGEFIAIHHSDDVWEPLKLEKQVEYLDGHPETGAVFSNVTPIGEEGEPFYDLARFNHEIFNQPWHNRYEWLNYFFSHGNALCHPSVLIRKVCYEKCGVYRHGMIQLPDFDMWVRLCFKYEIYVMPDKLIRFRVRENLANSSSPRIENRMRSTFEYLRVLENFCAIANFQELVNIFPAAQKYYRSDGSDILFVLGMVALETKPHKLAELFGLNLLFDALNQPERAKAIKEFYGFDTKKFREYAGSHDVFSLNLEMQLIQQQNMLVSLGTQVQALQENNKNGTAQTPSIFRKIRNRVISFWRGACS